MSAKVKCTFLAVLVPTLAFGAITEVTVKTTSTQAIISGQSDDPAQCKVRVSESENFNPIVHDVDVALFPGDDGATRKGNVIQNKQFMFVVGRRTVERATDGRWYSRALAAATKHWFEIACGSDTYPDTFTTKTVPLGNTYGEPLLYDRDHPGDYATPTLDFMKPSERIIDPQTGVVITRITKPGDQVRTEVTDASFVTADGADWKDANSLVVAGSRKRMAQVSGSRAPLVLRWNHVKRPLGSAAWNGDAPTLDYFQLHLRASGSAATAEDRTIRTCLSIDAVSCATDWKEVVVDGQLRDYWVGSKVPVDLWQSDPSKILSTPMLAQRSGNITYTAADRRVVLTAAPSVATGARNAFQPAWAAGTPVRIFDRSIRIENVTAGTPPTITTAEDHGFSTGDLVTVASVNGPIADFVNGTWRVTVVDARSFQLNGGDAQGTFGQEKAVCYGNGSTKPGTPPHVYLPNSFWQGDMRVRLTGFTSPGWSNLNDTVTQLTSYEGSSEIFEITGAETSGPYSQTNLDTPDCFQAQKYAKVTRLAGSVQRSTEYPVSRVISPTELILENGPDADIVADEKGVGRDYQAGGLAVIIQKKTDSADSIVIASATANYQTSGGATGGQCGTTKVTNYEGKEGYPCRIGDQSLWFLGENDFYYVGEMMPTPAGCPNSNWFMDPRDPNKYVCSAGSLMLARYTGKYERAPSPNYTIKDLKVTNLLSAVGMYHGATRDWLRAEDPQLDQLWPSGVYAWDGSVGYQGLMGAAYSTATESVHLAWMLKPTGLQNSTGKLYVIDLGNEIPWHTCSGNGQWPSCEGSTASTMRVIAKRDLWSGANCRWCGNHGGSLRSDESGMFVAMSTHPLNLWMTPGRIDGYGPYRTTIDRPFTDTPGSCAAFASNPYVRALDGVPRGGVANGLGCDVRVVGGEPCNDGPGANELSLVKANLDLHARKCGRSDAFWLQDAQVGDLITMTDVGEIVRLIDKGEDGRTWVFLRGNYLGNYLGNFVTHNKKGSLNHKTTDIFMWCNVGAVEESDFVSGIFYWDYMADPTPNEHNDPGLYRMLNTTDAHGFEGLGVEANSEVNKASAGCPTGSCFGVRTGTIRERLQKRTFDVVIGYGTKFAGVSGNGTLDTHPTGGDSQTWYDVQPLQGAGNPAATAKIGTQLYRWSRQTLGNSAPKVKTLDWMVYVGSYPTVDISSAATGDLIGTEAADAYKRCYAYRAGECRADSEAGDVYVNAPGVQSTESMNVCCNTDGGDVRDINIINLTWNVQTVVQRLLETDFVGRFGRMLTNGFAQYRKFDTYATVSLTPDRKALLYKVRWLSGARSELLKITLPPLEKDDIDRTTFIPVAVAGQLPDGAARARVKFGYAPEFRCTTRAEACYAVNRGVTANKPFVFEHELTGQEGSSDSQYTIAVPAISNRVLYYAVEYLDDKGAVVSNTGTGVVPVS